VQVLIQSKIKYYWYESADYKQIKERFFDPMSKVLHDLCNTWKTEKKKKESCRNDISISGLDTLAMFTLRYFTPKCSKPVEGQLDTTALKAVLNECSIFNGWRASDKKVAWFTIFFVTGIYSIN